MSVQGWMWLIVAVGGVVGLWRLIEVRGTELRGQLRRVVERRREVE